MTGAFHFSTPQGGANVQTIKQSAVRRAIPVCGVMMKMLPVRLKRKRKRNKRKTTREFCT